MTNQNYQCCFCGEKIQSNQIDVTALIVVSNWDKQPDLQQEQHLFCHADCLKSRLHQRVPLYIADLSD